MVVEAPACCRISICWLASPSVHVSLSRTRSNKLAECYQSGVSKERGGSARVMWWWLVDALRRTNNSAYMHTRHDLALRHCPRARHQPPCHLQP